MKNKFNGYKEYISSLLISFLIALLISIAVFTAIYLCGEKIINEYVSSDSYIYNTQAAYTTDFQKYVSDNKVSSNDFKSIHGFKEKSPNFFSYPLIMKHITFQQNFYVSKSPKIYHYIIRKYLFILQR